MAPTLHGMHVTVACVEGRQPVAVESRAGCPLGARSREVHNDAPGIAQELVLQIGL